MLQIDDVTGGYGKLNIIHNISFEIKEGSLVSLIGSNGAGKTTLLRTISGLLPVKKGTIKFYGEDISKISPNRIFKKGIIHVPEGKGIFENLTVRDNLLLSAYNRKNKKEIQEDLEKELERFPILREKIKDKAGMLSGGQQQMLAISMALMGKPKLLILDEPSLGLAPIIIQEILTSINNLCKETGLTVLLVEQMARKAIEISDYTYIFQNGRIVHKDYSKNLKLEELNEFL